MTVVLDIDPELVEMALAHSGRAPGSLLTDYQTLQLRDSTESETWECPFTRYIPVVLEGL